MMSWLEDEGSKLRNEAVQTQDRKELDMVQEVKDNQ